MADKATFTWDVFFKGKEGFAEHVQVGSESSEALIAGRGDLLLYLIANEASALPRDREPVKAAAPAAPALKAPTGIQPVCPSDGAQMQLRPPGISKATGNSYPAFWSCTNFPSCKGRMNA